MSGKYRKNKIKEKRGKGRRNKGNLFDVIGNSSYRNRHEQDFLSLFLSYSELFYLLTVGVEGYCCP
jgi:hypothetical protein